MKSNVSNLDRVIRVVLALIFGYLYFSGTVAGTLGMVLLVLGVAFLVTAAISFCPLYAIFKISTK